jgi:hypothetical protein
MRLAASGSNGDVADLVDDDQRDERQPTQLGFEAALALGLREPRDPLGGGRELHSLPREAGADRQRDSEVGLAGAGRVAVALLML